MASLKGQTSAFDKELERRTQEIGRELLERTRASQRRQPILGAGEDRILQWFMGNPEVRTRLLRFVDAYPSLRSPEQITEHLLEYLPPELGSLPVSLKLGEELVQHAHSASVRHMVASTVSYGVQRMAKRFICGETLEQALGTIRQLARQGMHFTLDVLGEEVVSEREAELYVEQYLQLLDALSMNFEHDPVRVEPPPGTTTSAQARHLPPINLSLKLSSLFSQFDPIAPHDCERFVAPRLLRILSAARKAGAFINVDMEQYERRDLTLWLFERTVASPEMNDYPHIGIVAQAYLKDAPKALERLIELSTRRQAPLTVRLVKGAYWDYEVVHARQLRYPIPVFTQKEETDAQFERMTRRLLEAAPQIRTAAATHNIRSLAHAEALRQMLEVPQWQMETQMLYGMGDPIKHALVSMGATVRVYTPYGPLVPGMGYLVRRLLENTANESFLRHSFFEHVSEEELLRSPQGEKSSPVGG